MEAMSLRLYGCAAGTYRAVVTEGCGFPYQKFQLTEVSHRSQVSVIVFVSSIRYHYLGTDAA